MMTVVKGTQKWKARSKVRDSIHIPKGKFLLSCLWKDGLTFQSKTGNQLSSADHMACLCLHPFALQKLM